MSSDGREMLRKHVIWRGFAPASHMPKLDFLDAKNFYSEKEGSTKYLMKDSNYDIEFSDDGIKLRTLQNAMKEDIKDLRSKQGFLCL